jgi:DNA replication ATP-dependent helicase Dna2
VLVDMQECRLAVGEGDLCADLWESELSLSGGRGNLLGVLSLPSCARLRALVVDLAEPRFGVLPSTIDVEGLNADQALALRKVLSSEDYTLLLGLPGTGKTVSIARLIASIARRGMSVLVTAYTHSAVDNLCVRIAEQRGVQYLRFGSLGDIRPEVQPCSLEALSRRCHDLKAYQAAIGKCRVFAATCMACHHHTLVQSTRFDLCVVDEASQIDVPTVIGPLALAKRFVLVGDLYQLPPLSKHGGNRRELRVSLFRMLSEAHPHAVVRLRTQYRMNRGLMQISNQLVYRDIMRCGLPRVAGRRMELMLSALEGMATAQQQFLRSVLSASPLSVVDVDGAQMWESTAMGSKLNLGEALVVAGVTLAMLKCGMRACEIAVISPYYAQAHQVRVTLGRCLALMARAGSPLREGDDVECFTVDKFQGRDKECVILTTVKSNPAGRPGTHMTDWQRLNVSVTRAKMKLIIVGSVRTLRGAPWFRALLEAADVAEILPLPPNWSEGLTAESLCDTLLPGCGLAQGGG